MILLHCCGQVYRADERHLGFSIRCTVCSQIIPIRGSEASTLPLNKPSKLKSLSLQAIYQRVARPFRTKHRPAKTWVLPILGIVALVVGLSLTFAGLRRRSQVASIVSSSSPDTLSNVRIPNATETGRPSPNASPSKAGNSPATPSPSQERALVPIPTPNDPMYPYGAIILATPIPTITPPSVRYVNGANLIRPQNVDGRGILTISNNTGFDAIVKLSDNQSGRPARSVYIRGYGNTEIGKISQGNYAVKFALGFDYNPASGLFNRPQTFKKFDEPFEFREYEADGYINWTTFEISLNPIVGGTAQASPINEREFRDH